MPKAGLEPARVSPYASETYVYTNFTTSAYSTVKNQRKVILLSAGEMCQFNFAL
jgi:hypothetical protein